MKKSASTLGLFFASALTGALIVSGIALVGVASAATTGQTPQGGQGYGMHFRGGPAPAMAPGIFGTVSAINGDTLTVTSNGQRFGPHPSSTTATQTPTTYTVDATNATVMKNGTSSTLSAITTGDTVMVRGTVSGTNVTATSIMDGVVPGGMGGFRGRPGMGNASGTPMAAFQGNGEPVIGGTVTAISGTTLTVTNKSAVTYTVDGSSATVDKGNTTSSISAVSVNDNVLVQGTVNGTSVTASTIIDQGATSTTGGTGAGGSGSPKGGFVGKMFGGIGSFFQHIFGFF